MSGRGPRCPDNLTAWRYKPVRTRRLVALLGIPLIFLGCPSDDVEDDDTGDDDASGDDTADDDTADDDDQAACTFSEPPAAYIDVYERWDGSVWMSQITAFVGDQPQPYEQQLVLEEGNCRYLKLYGGFCDPPCDPEDLCTGADQCVTEPAGISGGTLTIDGLVVPVTIEEMDYFPGSYVGPGLPADIFDIDSEVEARLSGDAFPAVGLSTTGVAPISVEEDDFPLVAGEDLEVTWTPESGSDACAWLYISGPQSLHGLPTNHIIWCESGDTGHLVVDRTIVDAFFDGGGAIAGDCYYVELSRFVRDTVDTAVGAAELRVRSVVMQNHLCW